MNPNFDINREKKKLRESNNKLLFKIKESTGENESNLTSDLMYTDIVSVAEEEETLVPSPQTRERGILDATRSKSVKNLLAKKDTFKMPSSNLSY